MKYLFQNLDKIKKQLIDKMIFLFLDYDGTLTPIVEKPEHAIIPKETKDLLRELSKIPHCKIAVISGRSIKNIRRLVGLSNIIYGGNHGLELAGPQVRFKSSISKKHSSILKKIGRILHNKLRFVKGVLIENKGLSLSVHYRLVSNRNVKLVRRIFCEVTAINFWRNEIRVRMGKKVLEVCPPVKWNKGKAVLWLLRHTSFAENIPVLPIYIGDDTTDEDAFKILKDSGLTVFVGKPTKSHAQYYVKDTSDVLNFLRMIIKLKTTPGNPKIY
jgi:trehalose-phosphatase